MSNTPPIGSNWSRHAFAEKVFVQPVSRLKALGRQTKRHGKAHVARLASSLQQFGWVTPIIIDEDLRVIAGLGRIAAARSLGWTEAPCLQVQHLTEIEKRLYVLADNRLSQGSEWDQEVLEAEFADLASCGADIPLGVTGFERAEIEQMGCGTTEHASSPEPAKPDVPVSVLGDVWECGPHLVGCLDATDPQSLLTLAPDETFAACITDAPYNVKVGGFVTSKGSHREFVMGSGEMSDEVFTTFLADAYGAAAARLEPGVCSTLRWTGGT